jgi:uncharacterized protein YpmS
MRRFVIILTLLFALFAFINAINASIREDETELLMDSGKTEAVL